jgi:hypothetical protein
VPCTNSLDCTLPALLRITSLWITAWTVLSIFSTWTYYIDVRLGYCHINLSHTRRMDLLYLLTVAGCVAYWDRLITILRVFANILCSGDHEHNITTLHQHLQVLLAPVGCLCWSLPHSQLWILLVLFVWVSVAFPLTPDLPILFGTFGWRCHPRGHGVYLYLLGLSVFCAARWRFVSTCLVGEVTCAGPPCYVTLYCTVPSHILVPPAGASAHLRTFFMAYRLHVLLMRTFHTIAVFKILHVSTKTCMDYISLLPRTDFWNVIIIGVMVQYLFQVFHCCGIGGLIISLQTKLYLLFSFS